MCRLITTLAVSWVVNTADYARWHTHHYDAIRHVSDHDCAGPNDRAGTNSPPVDNCRPDPNPRPRSNFDMSCDVRARSNVSSVVNYTIVIHARARIHNNMPSNYCRWIYDGTGRNQRSCADGGIHR
jgi:hypothetical protein